MVEHHRRVPTRLLECYRERSFGYPGAENLLVEGGKAEPWVSFSSPVGTAEFSRGRKPTECDRARFAQPRSGDRPSGARYLPPLRGLSSLPLQYRGLAPTAKLSRRYAAAAVVVVTTIQSYRIGDERGEELAATRRLADL